MGRGDPERVLEFENRQLTVGLLARLLGLILLSVTGLMAYAIVVNTIDRPPSSPLLTALAAYAIVLALGVVGFTLGLRLLFTAGVSYPERESTSLRIALGRAGFNDRLAGRWPLFRDVCAEVTARLDAFRRLSVAQLCALPEMESERIVIRGRRVTITTWRATVDVDWTLIVVQARFATLRGVNFIPLNALGHIGRLVVEGLLVTADGRITQAPDRLLWEFR